MVVASGAWGISVDQKNNPLQIRMNEALPAMIRMPHRKIGPSTKDRKEDDILNPISAGGMKHTPMIASWMVIWPLDSRAPNVINKPTTKMVAMDARSVAPDSFR